MNVRVRNLTSIFIVAALVVIADLSVMPILRKSLYRQASAGKVLVFDLVVVLLAGITGLFFASRLGCPIWWRSDDKSPTWRRVTLITLAVGAFVVAGNTLLCILYRNKIAELAPWITSLTPDTAVVLAFRAALTENIVFRLFLFPFLVWLVGCFMRSGRRSLIVGALLSALVYGLIHPGLVIGFLGGLAIIYIYYQRGLLAAMAVHFLGDAIPFVLLSVML